MIQKKQIYILSMLISFWIQVKIEAIDFERIKQVTETTKTLVPVLIIGSGVAGLSASIYTARAQLYTVIMAGHEPGGQLMGSSLVENMPGVAAQAGYKIITRMEQQAKAAGVNFLDDTLQKIEIAPSGDYFIVHTNNDRTMHALSIIIATGAFPNKLAVLGEDIYTNYGVFTCAVCDCRQATGKQVAVVGGGDSAIEAVMHLAPYAKQITLLVRGDRMRASIAMQEKLKKYSQVTVLYQQKVKEIVGNAKKAGVQDLNDAENDPWMSGIIVEHTVNRETAILPAECIFVAIGHTPNSALFAPIVSVDKNGYMQLDGRTQLTSRTGIFAAGDVTDPRYKQAGRASGDAIAAGLDAIAYLHGQGFSVARAQELSSCYFKDVRESQD